MKFDSIVFQVDLNMYQKKRSPQQEQQEEQHE